MNEQQPFQTFLELIKLDDAIRIVKEKIDVLEKKVTNIRGMQAQLDAARAAEEDAVRQARHSVHSLESEARDLDEQIKEKNTRLKTLSHYKEIQSMETEIKGLQKLQHDKELAVMSAWNKLESLEGQLVAKEQEITEEATKLSQSLDDVQETIAQLKKEIHGYEQERPAIVHKVPDEWLDKYQMMASRVVDPVVEIVDHSCGGCFYSISEQDFLRAGRRALIQCKGCFRLLYLPDAMQQENTEEDE